MAMFKDTSGRVWAVELTIGIARNTFDISKPETLTQLIDDPYQRFDLLWLLCKDQAEKYSIDVTSFDRLMLDERTCFEANNALIETIEDFFRRIGKESLALLISKTREAATMIDSTVKEKVSGMDSAIAKVVSKAMSKLEAEIAKAGE